MTRTILYPYKWESESAKHLADSLGIKRIKTENSKFVGKEGDIIINWGAHEYSNEVKKCKVLNSLPNLLLASNKLTFFQLCQGIDNGPRIPDWTDTPAVALQWLSSGSDVCIRATVTGSGGSGLSIVKSGNIDGLKPAPLYTKYIPKKDEYRVHFAFGKMIDIQKKGLKKGEDKSNVNFQIRNHSNGFIFFRDEIQPPGDVITQAEKAYKVSGLDFGAVDVIYNTKQEAAYVLEINTAPGMSPTTLKNYTQAFKEFLS